LDRTLPVESLMASVKVTALFRHLFKDIQIEDLWRPYFCVSSNLTQAEPVVHRQGPLWEAVRASTAIPGIFSPMLYGGDVLVDGGVMNHFPIDIMREQCGNGTLIAVNTSPRTEKLRNYQFGPSISGWHVLWSKINPFIPSQRVPSIFHTLVRATEINSVYRLPTIEGLANILIEPPVERFRTLDFGAYEEIMEVGYRAAQEQLAAVLPLTAPVVSPLAPSVMTPVQSV
jgi:predicted acylesterase/phospholipase RssA